MGILEGLGSSVLGYLLPFLFVLTVVVFFHELGHFLVARWCGVIVRTFSIGFGPELFGFVDRKGTRWRVAAIPLGGYVKFIDDTNAASMPDRSDGAHLTAEERAGRFQAKSVAARAAIVAAGPIANFILSIVIFALLFSLLGRPVTPPTVDAVQPGSAAEAAGFQPGDVVRSIDGREIAAFADLQRIVSGSAGETLDIVVERSGETLTLTATPTVRETTDNFGNKHRVAVLGLSHDTPDTVIVTYGPLEAIGAGVMETWYIVERTVSYVSNVVVGAEPADQLGGPIRVAQVSGQVATLGFAALVNLAAILSVSIGLINLFPIPLLDGGHLLFFAVEAVRGRPLSERAQDYGFRIGFMIVIMLMVFATWNDILHLTQL